MSALVRRRLGRYELAGVVSTGGTASVHFARQTGPLGFERIVAIKSAHAGLLAETKFRAMLEDEARILSRIRHPNVIAPIDVVLSDDELFLVLEYVPGETFARLWRASVDAKVPIPIEIAVAIVTGVLRGLHGAHEATSAKGEPLGIVHRDVSPQNIIVGTDGVPRVFDFGIAKSEDRTHTTEEGTIKGKIAYMAPEQLASERVDRRTDVYAAGVVLWEALTGRRLFDGSTPKAICEQVLVGCTEPPGLFRPEIPAALDDLVMKALSAKPDERFRTAEAFADALEDCVPPARARDLEAWVLRWARSAVEERAEQVRQIESLTPAESSPAAPLPAQADIRARSDSGGGLPSRPAPAMIFSLLALLVAVGVGVFAKMRGGRAVESLAASSDPMEPISSEDPAPMPVPSASGRGEPTKAEASTRPHFSKRPRARDDCKVPFVIDAQGHKVYRRECL